MILIAHRGLVNGPDLELENHPNQIIKALNLGFDVEVDLWVIDDKLYLGHDYPQYEITEEFLNPKKMWIHAKNLSSLHWLSKKLLYCYFWHQSDDFVITSNNYIWTYPEKELTDKSIRLMPEWKDPNFNTILQYKCAGICSDYVLNILNIIADNNK